MLDLCEFLSWFRPDHLFTGESNIMERGLIKIKLKASFWWVCFLQTCSFCLLKIFNDWLEWCGLLVDYCDVFISCLDSHSDGTHWLHPSDSMLHFSKSDEETNSSTSWLVWGWGHLQQIFIFWMNYSFNDGLGVTKDLPKTGLHKDIY